MILGDFLGGLYTGNMRAVARGAGQGSELICSPTLFPSFVPQLRSPAVAERAVARGAGQESELIFSPALFPSFVGPASGEELRGGTQDAHCASQLFRT